MMNRVRASNDNDFAYDDVETIRKRVRDNLFWVNTYFVKEDRSHPMCKYTWENALVTAQVEHLLWDVMDALHIDPKAKSYS
jgi:hypothetical protein